MNNKSFHRVSGSNAFTLIELLVVIAILSLLVAVLMPSLVKALSLARAAACMTNLRNHGLAVAMYASESNDVFPHNGYSELNPLAGHKSWKVMLAAFHDIDGLTSENVGSLVERGVFSCPANKDAMCANPAYGDNGYYGGYAWNWLYMGMLNEEYIYPASGWKCLPFVNESQVEAASLTIVMQDSHNRDLPAAAYVNFYIYPGQPPYNVNRHNDSGPNVLWADGRVSWESQTSLDNNRRWYKRASSDGWYRD